MPPSKRRKRKSSEKDENAIQNNLIAGITSTLLAMEAATLICIGCGLTSISRHKFSTKNGSSSECFKCLHNRINEAATCSVCDELKPSKEFTEAERAKKDGDGKCCKGCMTVPTLPTDEITLDALKCVSKEWKCVPRSQQTDVVISACKFLLSTGVDIRAITYFIRKESFKNDPISSPYFKDAIKNQIHRYLSRHLNPQLFRVVAENERIPHPPDEHSAMTEEINTLLDLNPATGMNNTTPSRHFGNPLREDVEVYAINSSAIESFESVNFQKCMFDAVENNFIEQHQLTLTIKRSELDTIVDDARAVNSDPTVYLPIIQEKLQTILIKQHRNEERTFFFYSGVNYFAGKHCPPEVIAEMTDSNNSLLLDVLKSAMAIKCGQSSKGLQGQFDKMKKFMTHNPSKHRGAVVVGVPIGSPSSSFSNEQATHLYSIDDHVYGEHYAIANKLNIVIEHFLNTTKGKVIFVGTVGEEKEYQAPASNNDGPGEVYEHQRIANADVRVLMRSFQSNHAVPSPSYEWYLAELATKGGSTFLDSDHQKDSASMKQRHKSIEAYLRAQCFYSSPYNELAVVSHNSKNARADEAEFYSYLHSNNIARVSGETFDTPGNIAEGTSMLRLFLEQKGSAVNEMLPVTIKNETSTQYYNKQALQQYIQSGIVSRDHILKLWAGGIIERC